MLTTFAIYLGIGVIAGVLAGLLGVGGGATCEAQETAFTLSSAPDPAPGRSVPLDTQHILPVG